MEKYNGYGVQINIAGLRGSTMAMITSHSVGLMGSILAMITSHNVDLMGSTMAIPFYAILFQEFSFLGRFGIGWPIVADYTVVVCTKYLVVCTEQFTGFHRTLKWFAQNN